MAQFPPIPVYPEVWLGFQLLKPSFAQDVVFADPRDRNLSSGIFFWSYKARIHPTTPVTYGGFLKRGVPLLITHFWEFPWNKPTIFRAIPWLWKLPLKVTLGTSGQIQGACDRKPGRVARARGAHGRHGVESCWVCPHSPSRRRRKCTRIGKLVLVDKSTSDTVNGGAYKPTQIYRGWVSYNWIW